VGKKKATQKRRTNQQSWAARSKDGEGSSASGGGGQGVKKNNKEVVPPPLNQRQKGKKKNPQEAKGSKGFQKRSCSGQKGAKGKKKSIITARGRGKGKSTNAKAKNTTPTPFKRIRIVHQSGGPRDPPATQGPPRVKKGAQEEGAKIQGVNRGGSGQDKGADKGSKKSKQRGGGSKGGGGSNFPMEGLGSTKKISGQTRVRGARGAPQQRSTNALRQAGTKSTQHQRPTPSGKEWARGLQIGGQ